MYWLLSLPVDKYIVMQHVFLKEDDFYLTASTWSPLLVYKNNDSLLERSYEIRIGNEVYWKTVPLKHTSLNSYIKIAQKIIFAPVWKLNDVDFVRMAVVSRVQLRNVMAHGDARDGK